MGIHSEWHNRTRFAEPAEALDITTDCVMAGVQEGDWWWVLYTESPETHDEDWIHLAVLGRDRNRVLTIRQEKLVMQMRDFHGEYEELFRRATS